MSSAPAAETQAAAVTGASWAWQSVSGQLNANMAHSATAPNCEGGLEIENSRWHATYAD